MWLDPLGGSAEKWSSILDFVCKLDESYLAAVMIQFYTHVLVIWLLQMLLADFDCAICARPDHFDCS